MFRSFFALKLHMFSGAPPPDLVQAFWPLGGPRRLSAKKCIRNVINRPLISCATVAGLVSGHFHAFRPFETAGARAGAGVLHPMHQTPFQGEIRSNWAPPLELVQVFYTQYNGVPFFGFWHLLSSPLPELVQVFWPPFEGVLSARTRGKSGNEIWKF
jgi:hypothetical protein